MKKLMIVFLCALILCGCVSPEQQETVSPTVVPTESPTIETVTPTPVIPGPQEMPTQGGDYQLPPGEDNIPDETHTH